MNSKIKNIIIFSIIGIALVLVYMFFIKKTPAETSLLTSSNPASSIDSSITTEEIDSDLAQIEQDFLPLLLSVKNIKLDDTIFSDLAFSSFKDSSIVIIQEGNEGRPNPFAPIGSEASFFTNTAPPITPTDNVINPN